MEYLNNRFINKEATRDLFSQDYEIVSINSYYEKDTYIENSILLKIRGVKEPVLIKLHFKEPIDGGLSLCDWSVLHSNVKIGEGRKAAIEAEIINIFNKEEYLLPHWIDNKYLSCCHLINDFSRKKSVSFILEKNVESELLIEAFSVMPYDSHSLEKTQLVLHNNKVYSRSLENIERLLSDEEIMAYVKNNSNRYDKDIILDKEGNIYTFYHKPDDLNNIRLIRKEAYHSNPISSYSTSDNTHTYREFAAQQELEIEEVYPIVYRVETETEKTIYSNGERSIIPFTQIIEMKIYSPRVLGEGLPEYQLSDYVRYSHDKTGYIIDISERDKGIYGIQDESTWVLYGGEKADFDYIHTSLIEKIDKPTQENVGQIVFEYKRANNSYDKGQHGYLGEVVYEFTKHYVVKIATFINEKPSAITSKLGLRRDYHAKYVDCKDGYIYATVLKDNCYFLRPEYVGWYEQFKNQSEQFEWIKNHNILKTFLYPLLSIIDDRVLRSSLYALDYQFSAFCVYLDYYTDNKAPEDFYLSFIEYFGEKNYDYLKNITLKGMYQTPEVLDKFFSKERVESLPLLEEILF